MSLTRQQEIKDKLEYHGILASPQFIRDMDRKIPSHITAAQIVEICLCILLEKYEPEVYH